MYSGIPLTRTRYLANKNITFCSQLHMTVYYLIPEIRTPPVMRTPELVPRVSAIVARVGEWAAILCTYVWGISFSESKSHVEGLCNYFSRFIAFEVDVTYNSTGSYTLSSPSPSPSSTGEGPTEAIPSWNANASGCLSQEGGSLVLKGFIGKQGVRANLAVIDNTLHLFTMVSNIEL